jgi:RHS repeat-associated protein
LYAAGERKSIVFTPNCSDADPNAVWSQQFNYDAAGNRTVACRGGDAVSPPGEVSSISPATNRILDANWAYDAAGNITASPYAPSITYDAENRQVAYCTALAVGGGCTPSGLTQYVYDGDGQRVQKVTASGTVTYVYDAFGNLAAEYGGTASAAGTQYVTGDHLTSTRLVTPGTATQVASGIGIERHDYYPFGFEAAGGWRTSGLGYGTDTVRQKFTGQERDGESTLDFFQARYYSGPQGRFMSVDPGNAGASLGDPQSWNGYAYVSNGPMMYTDPNGTGIFGDILGFAGSFLGPLGTFAGWLVGSEVDLATGGSISPFDFSGAFGVSNTLMPKGPGGTNPTLGGINTLVWGNPNPFVIDNFGDGPDFTTANLNISIPTPWTGTLLGWSGTFTIDRYGQRYYSVRGIGVGKALTGISGSLTINEMNTPASCRVTNSCQAPSAKELKEFLTGHGINVTYGWGFGASYSVSPDRKSSVGIGIVSPQIGIGYNYSVKLKDATVRRPNRHHPAPIWVFGHYN